MGTQGTGRKRNPNKERSTVEEDALKLIAREAEARLAAKRAARAEAREIRMKELERQQKEIYQVQKKYYGLDNKLDDRADAKWGDIEQWMEDSERYSHPSRNLISISDDEEHVPVGIRDSARGASLHCIKKSKKKKKHKHKERDSNGFEDGSSWSSRLSDESSATRSSRLDLTSSKLSDQSRLSRSSRLDFQSTSYGSSDLHSLNGVSLSKLQGSSYNGHQGLLYEDSLHGGSRRVTSSSSHPAEYSSYRGSSSRSSSRASLGRTSPVAEDRDYLEKGSRKTSIKSSTTLTSLGGTSSRRGSGETSIAVDTETSIRDIKEIHELKDQIQDVETKYVQNLKEVKDAMVVVEEKYRKAMVSNAQLDNEKNNLMYYVDTLKDSLMELEELLSESRRDYEEKTKEYEREKHNHSVLQFQFNELKETIKQSEELLTEIRQLRLKQEGFVREVSDLQETVEWKDKKIAALERQKGYSEAIRSERDELRDEVVQLKDILKKHGIVLCPDLSVNGETIELGSDGPVIIDLSSRPALDLQTSPTEGNSILEIRLRKLVDDREKLIEQVKKQKAQLEQTTQRSGSEDGLSPDVVENGTDPHILDLHRDANRQISDLKFKLVKIEQEATASEQNVIRLDAQVMRYKTAAENAEKVEDELKAEKRKLQRELRAALDKIDEVESNNSHLSKRLEKMKANRTTAPTP